MRSLVALAVAACGCSLTFDDTAPEIPLVGHAPDLTGYPRLNRVPLQKSSDEWLSYGADGSYWFTTFERPSTLHLTRLAEPYAETELQINGSFTVLWRSIYLINSDPNGKKATELTIYPIGALDDPTAYALPPGKPVIISGGNDDVLAYWIKDDGMTTYDVVMRDHLHGRGGLPFPDGIMATDPPSWLFFINVSWFVTRDAKDHLIVHSTTAETDIALGVRPPLVLILGGRKPALITLGDDGVRLVPIDGSQETVLEPSPVTSDDWAILDGKLAYLVGDELRAVPFDGTEPPVLIRKGDFVRIYGSAPDGRLVFSKDPSNRYIYGVGDAWIGDWRFMERGLLMQFSADGKKVRWIDHAAQAGGSGDLLAATIPAAGMPAPSPLRLARNVHQFHEATDGRIVAVANRAFLGTQNRVIVIDEKKKTAQWVANAAYAYRGVPGSTDLLVDIITSASTHDVVRVPVPAP